MIAILPEIKWNLSVLWIFISTVAEDTEHIFYVYIDHLYFFLWKVLSSSLAHILIRLFALLVFNFQFLNKNLNIDPLTESFPIFMLSVHSTDCFFCCTVVFLNFTKSHLSHLTLISWDSEFLFRNSLPMPVSQSSPPMFSSSSFKNLSQH
jgi:hypothetical protein